MPGFLGRDIASGMNTLTAQVQYCRFWLNKAYHQVVLEWQLFIFLSTLFSVSLDLYLYVFII